ncbi:hypothetical protein N8933_10500 [Pseudomonadales bacterium]|nr:hypothetical protein [Pseudomonadales bacterium]
MNEFFNKTKVKWSLILVLLAGFPLVGIPWLAYELWVLQTQSKLTAIFRIIENIDPPKVSDTGQIPDKKYSEEELRRIKNTLILQEEYWDDNLPTEFCIAYVTRNALLSRSIVNNFVKSRQTAKDQGMSESFSASLWQQYFKEYVTSEQKMGEFWAIFIEPSEDFVEDLSKLDGDWYPIVTEAVSNQTDFEFEDSLNKELTDLFHKHRNKNLWSDDNDWMWFFRQYVHFLMNNDMDPEVKIGMIYFIRVVCVMQKTVESSGWQIDYNLYDDPLSVWGGQTIQSKIKHWLRAKKLELDIRGKFPL